jgi:ABC-type transporter Mla MlaB component
MKSELVEGENSATLTVSGDLTIHNASGFRDVLREWTEKSDTLYLDLGGVEDADLTCLQLVCSAHRFMMNKSKHLNMAGELPDSIIKVARAAGFARKRGCRAEAKNTCVWIMNDEDEK